LRKIRQFYLTYPIRDALRLELSWTHYRILMRVEKPEARSFYSYWGHRVGGKTEVKEDVTIRDILLKKEAAYGRVIATGSS